MLYVTTDEVTNTGYIYAVIDAKLGFGSSYNECEAVIRSSDHGQSWTVLNKYASNPVSSGGNESKLAQLSSGNLIMSIRSAGARRFSTSTDEGATWSTPVSSTIVEPSCNGDLINVSYNTKSYLLQTVANDASSRKNVSIYYSADDGTTWTLGRVLCADASAYSALVRLNDGSIGCYVEEGDNTNGYNMVFYRMTMADILPAQGVSDNYDGTMVCNGLGYMVVPKDNENFIVKPGHPLTITTRVLLNAFTNEENKDYGVLSTRWHDVNTTATSSTTEITAKSADDLAAAHVFTGAEGFEFIAGKNASESFGANVSIEGSSSGTTLGVLDNKYYSNMVLPSRWSHIAMVADADAGYVKIYVDGVLAETQTVDKRTPTLLMKGATINMLTDMLIGTRYEKLTTEQITTTTSNSPLRGKGGNGNNGQGGNNQGNNNQGNNNQGGYTTTVYNDTITSSMVISKERIFNSNIDDVRIYSAAFTDAQVLKDKQSGFPILTKGNGLLAAYDFADMELNNSGTAYVFKDISGNGHNGTTVGVEYTDSLGVTGTYAFPEILHNVKVLPKTPALVGNVSPGTLTVTRFDDGKEKTLKNDSIYEASLYQDFKATAEPAEGWVLVGIYVNGVKVASNGFFKAGSNAVIEARFRREGDPLNFYLVSDVQFNADDKYVREYQFTPSDVDSNGYGTYTLTINGRLQGTFNVIQRIDPSGDIAAAAYSDDDLTMLDLYSTESDANTDNLKVMSLNIAYPLDNELLTLSDYASMIQAISGDYASMIQAISDDDDDDDDSDTTATASGNKTLFSVHPQAITDGTKCITDPEFEFVYKPDEGIITLKITGYTATGVDDVTAENDAEAEYYNLQGIRISKPARGIYIVRKGTAVSKAIAM
jgi:hypothetical protein